MSIELDASEARAVRLALKQPGLTRNDLGALLGASAPTTAALVKRLVQSEMFIEDGAAPSTGGRPAAKLYVSERIGYCCSHQVVRGRLTSFAATPSGSVLGSVDRPVKDIPSMLRGVGAAELELSVRAPDRVLLASGIVIPGIVDQRTNTGEAPWLFGKETIDPAAIASSSILISSAGCLTSRQEMSTSISADGPWLAVDMANSLSGLFLTQRGEPVPLDLAHLEPNPAIISDDALERAIRQAAESKSSLLGKKLADNPPLEAFAEALQDNDQVACGLVDRLVAETLEFARNLARTLRPNRLILASNLLDPALELNDTIRTGMIRQAGVKSEALVLIAPQDVIEQRFVGACSAALSRRLGDVERNGGVLKVE